MADKWFACSLGFGGGNNIFEMLAIKKGRKLSGRTFACFMGMNCLINVIAIDDSNCFVDTNEIFRLAFMVCNYMDFL